METIQTRRALLKKVGAGVTVGTLSVVLRSNEAAAYPDTVAKVAQYYQNERNKYPWFPPVTVVENEPAGSNTMRGYWSSANWRYEISIPPDLLAIGVTQGWVAHESGHILDRYVRNARGAVWSANPPNPSLKGRWDLWKEWLRYVGGNESAADTNPTHCEEWFADSYCRSQGNEARYPNYVPEYPFNQQQMLNFINQIKPPSDDGYMYISPDLPIVTDGNGNYFGSVPITGMYGPAVGEVPILGVAQRIGLDGTESILPDLTFSVPTEANGQWGRLMVRGDYVRGGTTYFRIAAFQ